VQSDAGGEPIKLHAEKKGRITHVFNLEFGLHLSTEEEWILPNQDEVVYMGEDPERSWKTTPEHARIGDRGGKSDRGEKQAETTVPGKGSLFEAIDGFDESKNYPLT
jgi:hypothetical protein